MRWALFICLAVAVAQAGPQVEIRAHTQLSFTGAQKRDNGEVEVSGRLTDKLTGDGIASERVYVTVNGQMFPAFTSADGSFHLVVPAPSGAIDVAMTYRGGKSLEGAQPLTVSTDPAKVPLHLDIVKVVDDPAGARIKVNASTIEDAALDVPVKLSVAPVGEEDFKLVRTVQTGDEITFTRTEAGGAGTHRLRATFVGDDTRQAAEATVTIELTSGTTTTMRLSTTKLAFEDELDVVGHVVDDDKHPVERASVTLMAGDRRLAQTATDKNGRYSFEVEAQIIAAVPLPPTQKGTKVENEGGQFGIQVKADPDVPAMRASHSDPVVITIAAPQPVPVSWTIVAFIATVAAAGGFFAARTKPWTKFRKRVPPAEVPSEEGDVVEQIKGGLVVAKPGVVATLRRPQDDGFSGVVRDTVRGRPISDAVVTLILGARVTETGTPVPNERSTRTTLDGSFAIENLGPGEWRAEVAAPGHVTERFGVTIPHRGELRGVRVDLVPVRERVFQLYRRAAEPVLPESKLWGIWSPRMIVDHVRSKRPSPALADLTDFVEEVYFSPRMAAETVISEANQRVDRAIGERAARR
ncbi:MAG TPA: carboxypeptidase-like regulatory domain-containing protein [Kofleriaceae bacterium]|nr:carboxypeptidase-like regulatory domain-containing protein [Kofleriaceae bacterium]